MDTCPLGQLTQVAANVAEVVVENVPAGQSEHELEPESANFPALHAVQVFPASYVPAAHVVQLDAPDPDTCPAPQLKH